ncbi:hypothetical protein WUBG_16797 [Wuchereria bancrofti]|uniref:C-type lectin domain-containing protein n=1 Tax=Wuchereria bancrofti TaxID=6293 RepID=J9E5N9_WUCBA|nr:hypothetical protein WUBG_16797 [Wuchereria bancrofti]
MRWSEAERACANFGGHLASITDEYENMFAFSNKRCKFVNANIMVGTIG